jgi:hypothetical protein
MLRGEGCLNPASFSHSVRESFVRWWEGPGKVVRGVEPVYFLDHHHAASFRSKAIANPLLSQ